MVTREELDADTRAFLDAAERIARDDLDWGVYWDGEARPSYPWWRRVLKV